MNDPETVFKKDVQIPSVTPKRKVPGEAGAVKVEVQGQQGNTTLTANAEPYNGAMSHACRAAASSRKGEHSSPNFNDES